MLTSSNLINGGIVAGVVGAGAWMSQGSDSGKYSKMHGTSKMVSRRNLAMDQFAQDQNIGNPVGWGAAGAVIGGSAAYYGTSKVVGAGVNALRDVPGRAGPTIGNLKTRNGPTVANFKSSAKGRVASALDGRFKGTLGFAGAIAGGALASSVSENIGTSGRGQLFHSYVGDQGPDSAVGEGFSPNSPDRVVGMARAGLGGAAAYVGTRSLGKVGQAIYNDPMTKANKAIRTSTGKVGGGMIGLGVAYMLSQRSKTSDPNSSRIRGLGY